MKDRPLICCGQLVRAILDGRKTQTRRVTKPQPKDGETMDVECLPFFCPYGKVGDRLWVKEKHAFGGNGVFFPDSCDGTVRIAWTSSRFMPKKFARIWLEITNIRVERVQDITEKDAIAEGVEVCFQHSPHHKKRASFSLLWDSLNAERGFGWYKNPWVWVIEFKRVLNDPAN